MAVAPTPAYQAVPEFNSQQLRWAQAVIAEIKARGLPKRAAYVAFATIFQESDFQMYANGNNPQSLALPHDAVGWDHGSVGLYQQQVGGAPNSTANWGTTSQLMNVQTSTDKFLSALTAIPGWQQMGIGQAAQRVQNSAYPDAYAQHEAESVRIVDALWDGTPAGSRTGFPLTSGGASTIAGFPSIAANGATGLLKLVSQLLGGLFTKNPGSGGSGLTGTTPSASQFPGPPPPFDPQTLTVPLGTKRTAVVNWCAKWASYTRGTKASIPSDATIAGWTAYFQAKTDSQLVNDGLGYKAFVAEYVSDPTGDANQPDARTQVDVIYSTLLRVVLVVIGAIVAWFAVKQLIGN